LGPAWAEMNTGFTPSACEVDHVTALSHLEFLP
jgi:hypothetical protein